MATFVHLPTVPFEFGHIVGNVVNQLQGCPAEHPVETPPYKQSHYLAVCKGEVCRGAHCLDVGLAGTRIGRQVGQHLPASGVLRPLRRDVHIFVGDLVTEPPGAGMNHHHDLVLEQAEPLGKLGVEDLLDILNLDEVVPATQGAELCRALLYRRLRDGAWLSRQATIFFDPLQVFCEFIRVKCLPGAVSAAAHQLRYRRSTVIDDGLEPVFIQAEILVPFA